MGWVRGRYRRAADAVAATFPDQHAADADSGLRTRCAIAPQPSFVVWRRTLPRSAQGALLELPTKDILQ